jgi:hypothetical protein
MRRHNWSSCIDQASEPSAEAGFYRNRDFSLSIASQVMGPVWKQPYVQRTLWVLSPGYKDASHETNRTPLCRVGVKNSCLRSSAGLDGVKNACLRSSAGLDGVVLKHSDKC